MTSPFRDAVIRAVDEGRPDAWVWHLPRGQQGWPPEYRPTALHSLAAAQGPGWSDAIRALDHLRAGLDHPGLDKRFYARLEAGS